MFDSRLLAPEDFAQWNDYRVSLATGSGISRDPRRHTDVAGVSVRSLRNFDVVAPVLHQWDADDTGETGVQAYRWSRHGRIVIDVPEMPEHLFAISPSDYRRVQKLRVALEWATMKRYVPGWQEPRLSPFGGFDRFRKFDPRPAFDGIGSSGLITYVER